jgi:hypothetical protein
MRPLVQATAIGSRQHIFCGCRPGFLRLPLVLYPPLINLSGVFVLRQQFSNFKFKAEAVGVVTVTIYIKYLGVYICYLV